MKIPFTAILFAFILCATSCTHHSDSIDNPVADKLVGKWLNVAILYDIAGTHIYGDSDQIDSNNVIYEFYQNGTGEMVMTTSSQRFTWQLVSNNTCLKMFFNGTPAVVGTAIDLIYSLTPTSMILQDTSAGYIYDFWEVFTKQ